MSKKALEALDLVRVMRLHRATAHQMVKACESTPATMWPEGEWQWYELTESEPEILGAMIFWSDVDDGFWKNATPYWCGSEMVDLIAAAADQLPEAAGLVEPPSPEGVVLFDHPIPNQMPNGEDELVGFRWGRVPEGVNVRDAEGRDYQALAIVGSLNRWGDSDEHKHARRVCGGAPVSSNAFFALAEESQGWSARLLKTFFLLCQQRVATVSQLLPDRAERRRFQRGNLGEAPDVSILQLRRSASGSEGDGGEVNWSHRWIVGAHWRNQYRRGCETCVSGEQACGRHPTWIAPHVKGPEDKPLVTDRVYELVR